MRGKAQPSFAVPETLTRLWHWKRNRTLPPSRRGRDPCRDFRKDSNQAWPTVLGLRPPGAANRGRRSTLLGAPALGHHGLAHCPGRYPDRGEARLFGARPAVAFGAAPGDL